MEIQHFEVKYKNLSDEMRSAILQIPLMRSKNKKSSEGTNKDVVGEFKKSPKTFQFWRELNNVGSRVYNLPMLITKLNEILKIYRKGHL